MPNRPPQFKSTQKAKLPAYRRPDHRPSRHVRGYTNAWYRLRAWHIARHPLCAHCEARGVVTPAQDVDHINPISNGGDNLDPDNLQSLCRACHNIKTRNQ